LLYRYARVNGKGRIVTTLDDSGGPDDSEGTLGRRPVFVVGVDGTDSGLTALRQAANEAGPANARLLCVHVRRPPGMWEVMACLGMNAVALSREGRDAMELRAWLHCVQTLDPLPLPWDLKVVSGRPGRCLRQIADAKHGDALFLGTARRGARSPFHRYTDTI
jgi:nucleotide-binding universal stress UspA family protein